MKTPSPWGFFFGEVLVKKTKEVIKMKKAFVTLGVAILFLLPFSALAQQEATYGPYKVLSMDKAVVEDVLVEANGLYVKVNQSYWGSEFIVKGSAKNNEIYTTWANGTNEMPVKVYQSQVKNKQGYTYRINTGATFVEYWTGGKLVLHLEKVK
jgi:hypothetical protein